MFDTMYIFHQLTKMEYSELFKELNDLSYWTSRKKLYRDRYDHDTYVTNCLSDVGLECIKLRHKQSVNYRAIEIKLRPKLLIDKHNYIDLTSISEIESVREKFSSIANHFKLPDLLQWRVKRIDAAVDLLLSEQNIVNYMFLLKKCNMPDFMQKNKLTTRYLNSKHNVYLNSNKITVNFYNRFITLFNKIMVGKIRNDTDISRAENILRFEVQYKKCSGELTDYFNIDFSRNLINRYYNQTIGTGDYYKLEDAYALVDSKIGGSLNQFQTRALLRRVAEHGSIYEAKEQFIQNHSKGRKKAIKEFSRLIRQLHNIGVNPVTLSTDMNIDFLSNLHKKIMECFVEQVRLS